jgi:hypothetical protein
MSQDVLRQRLINDAAAMLWEARAQTMPYTDYARRLQSAAL